jgi:hypothetical protein
MKRSILLSLAGLTLVGACTDNPVRPTDAVIAPQGQLKPLGLAKDDISNNLDASIDAAAEIMALSVGGTNGTTTLYLNPTGGDGKPGCNVTGGTSLGLSVSSSNTAVATVSPSTVAFTSCGDTKLLTITPVAVGSTTISVSQTSNTTGGTFTLGPASFTVNVTAPPPANTPPTVSVTGVTGGTSYNKGFVPTAACQIIDAEDGNSTKQATLSAITGPYASDGIGSQTASCSYTDDGGLTASSSLSYNIIDPTAPTIAYSLNPTAADGSNGWYKSSVTLTWTVTENDSPNSLQKTGCVDQSITADQVETTYSCSAESAGGAASSNPVEVKIKRDATAPGVTYTSASPASPNADLWYNTAVTATFTASDATSGFAGAPTKTGTATTSGEGASVTVGSPAFTDDAGNSVAAGAETSASYKIDLTKPTNVAFVGGPASGGTYYYGFVPAAPTCTAQDALSGLKGCVVGGYSAAVGSHTLTATATDFADNVETATLSYTVSNWTLNGFYQPVDMGNVANTVKAGSTVPLKFEIFAGSTELTATSSVKGFSATMIACDATAPTDEVEITSTGGTTLRYDATAGQFIQNWQTPKAPGACYRASITTQDDSKITAVFKLK